MIKSRFLGREQGLFCLGAAQRNSLSDVVDLSSSVRIGSAVGERRNRTMML
jgi:hypothetical protein